MQSRKWPGSLSQQLCLGRQEEEEREEEEYQRIPPPLRKELTEPMPLRKQPQQKTNRLAPVMRP